MESVGRHHILLKLMSERNILSQMAIPMVLEVVRKAWH